MTLTRERIKRIQDAAERQVRLWTLDDVIQLCVLALRALPLPEGEVKELVTQARKAAEILANDGEDELVKRTSKYPGDFIRELTDTLSRQAASLATAERERDKWREVAGETEDECEKAEASLASARREINEAAGFLRYLTRGLSSPTADKVKAWLERAPVLTDAIAEISSLRGALNKYGRHYESCPARTEPTATCDCGFETTMDSLSSLPKS